MGDPAGVGPEVIAGSWLDPAARACSSRAVVGTPAVMERAIRLLRLPLEVLAIRSPGECDGLPADVIPVLDIGYRDAEAVPPGCELAEGGEAAFRCVERAVGLALGNEADAIVTAPLSKRALHLAGHTRWPGHTELLADLCGVQKTAMMLYLSTRCPLVRSEAGLGVIHVTLHCSVRAALERLDQAGILATARLTSRFVADLLRAKGIPHAPRIGVAALNPHAGEAGLFGDEEQRIIRPAVEAGLAEGLCLSGPLPCDTLMHRAADGEFDAVVAMLHDQGHIALKLLGLHHAVNVTLGLPIIRTSVAHGTAFDIAWQGTARHSSMVEALAVAAELVTARAGRESQLT
jgi:4-phospho-D-threonate 3-dehydrogenase / 4-phospho-D-erythronate 3-dehydrogenase